MHDGEVLGVGWVPSRAGLVIFDVDVHGTTDGRELAGSLGIPHDVVVETASGGEHRIVRKLSETVHVTNESPWGADGIDVRGDRGFGVAPGTFTPWGSWELFINWARTDYSKLTDAITAALVAAPPCPADLWDQLTTTSANGSSSAKSAWAKYDPADVDDLTAKAVAVLCSEPYNGHHATTVHKEGREPSVDLIGPHKNSGRSASVGFLGPGVVQIWTSSWKPHFEISHNYVLDDGDTFVDWRSSSDELFDSAGQSRGSRGAFSASSAYSAVTSSTKPKGLPLGWPVLDDAARHGLASEVVDALDEHTEADPTAMLVTFLTMFGNAVGAGPHARVGADQHPGRLFVANVGDTSKARKGSGVSMVRAVMVKADPEWSKRMLSGFGSGEKVVDDVRDGEGEQHANDRRLLIREPELARVLKVVERDHSVLSPLLRQAWDNGNLSVRTRASTVVATGAHVSVLGDITIDELRRGLSSTEASNGFANRFLYVPARRSKRLPSGGNLDDKTVDRLAKKVAQKLRSARQRGVLLRTPAAVTLWNTVYDVADDDADGLIGSVTARAEANMLRLSVIFALLDGAKVIDVEHVWAAVAVWSYCEQGARFIFDGRTGDEVADRLLDAITKASATGLDGTAQNGLFAGHVARERLVQARERLEREGLIVTTNQSTGGRDRIVSVLAEKAENAEKAPTTFIERVRAAVAL